MRVRVRWRFPRTSVTPAPRPADDIRPRYRIAAAKELPSDCRGVSASDNAPLCQRQSARRRLSTCREAIQQRGFTQKELAAKTGLIQALVSDYERGKLRLNADMILRFATALEITTDELLQPGGPKPARKPSRRVLRRLEQIETLPSPQQTVLLRTIDTFLENAAFRAARR